MELPFAVYGKTACILTGVQGAGKSTFCAAVLPDIPRVNLDTLRTRNRERLTLESLIASGSPLVIDNTDPTAADRARYLPSLKAAGYTVHALWFDVPKDFCLSHNARREGKARVPDVAVHATFARLEVPSVSEGFDAVWRVRNDGVSFTVTALV